MLRKRMLVVLLSGKAAEDDRLSVLIPVFIGNRGTVRGIRQRTWRPPLHLELLLERHSSELCISPLHFQFFCRNNLLLEDSQHLVPAEAGNSRLCMSPFVHPAGTGLHKEMSPGGNILLHNL